MDSDITSLFGREPEEMVIEIEIERLRDFKNHPFKIRDDLQMRSLKESIQKYGILTANVKHFFTLIPSHLCTVLDLHNHPDRYHHSIIGSKKAIPHVVPGLFLIRELPGEHPGPGSL